MEELLRKKKRMLEGGREGGRGGRTVEGEGGGLVSFPRDRAAGEQQRKEGTGRATEEKVGKDGEGEEGGKGVEGRQATPCTPQKMKGRKEGGREGDRLAAYLLPSSTRLLPLFLDDSGRGRA